MRGNRTDTHDFGRLGAEARLAQIERRQKFWKIGLMIAYSIGAIVFIKHEAIISAITSSYSDRQIKPKTQLASTATMDERPFAGLRVRHARKQRKRSDSKWFVWGVSRFQTPAFYLGVWARDNPRHLSYDIEKQLKKYKTLSTWGEVRLDGNKEQYQTGIGRFQIQRFTYHPPAGAQKCVYFSSVNIAPGGYVRGHYCVAASMNLDYDLLQCAISSVRHPKLELSAPKKVQGCQGRKIDMVKLRVQKPNGRKPHQ